MRFDFWNGIWFSKGIVCTEHTLGILLCGKPSFLLELKMAFFCGRFGQVRKFLLKPLFSYSSKQVSASSVYALRDSFPIASSGWLVHVSHSTWFVCIGRDHLGRDEWNIIIVHHLRIPIVCWLPTSRPSLDESSVGVCLSGCRVTVTSPIESMTPNPTRASPWYVLSTHRWLPNCAAVCKSAMRCGFTMFILLWSIPTVSKSTVLRNSQFHTSSNFHKLSLRDQSPQCNQSIRRRLESKIIPIKLETATSSHAS